VQDLLALGVADLLQDHLLGVLRKAPPKRFFVLGQLFLDEVVDLDFRIVFLGVGQDDLVPGFLQSRLVGHHDPATEGVVLARLAIDRDRISLPFTACS
jgi:hypothetical protein